MPKKLPFLPDEYHYAIAHVASRAAQLDHQIEFSVATQMLPHRHTAKYLVKNLDTNRLVRLLHALLRDNFNDRHTQIDELIERISNARQERNEVLHWLWSKGEDDTVRHGTVRPYHDTQTKTKTAQQIYDVADLFLESVIALHQLDDEHTKNLTARMAQASSSLDTPETPVHPHDSASPETQDHLSTGGLLGPLPPPSQE